jgi:hypothetical protein
MNFYSMLAEDSAPQLLPPFPTSRASRAEGAC